MALIGPAVAQTGKGVGTVEDDLREGPWTFYYANGKKSATGSYSADDRTGDWTWFYPDGRVRMKSKNGSMMFISAWCTTRSRKGAALIIRGLGSYILKVE